MREEDLVVLCSKIKPFQSKLQRKWVQGLGAEQRAAAFMKDASAANKHSTSPPLEDKGEEDEDEEEDGDEDADADADEDSDEERVGDLQVRIVSLSERDLIKSQELSFPSTRRSLASSRGLDPQRRWRDVLSRSERSSHARPG